MKPYSHLTLFLALPLIAFWAVSQGHNTLAPAQFDIVQLAQHLAALAFLALVAERAVEVHLTTHFDAEKSRIMQPMKLVEQRLSHLNHMLFTTGTEARNEFVHPQFETELRAEILDEYRTLRGHRLDLLGEMHPSLAKLHNKKAARAALLTCGFGMLVALTGISALGPLLTIQTSFDWALQSVIIKMTDILLTALLIAGGADGIHQIMRRLRPFITKVD